LKEINLDCHDENQELKKKRFEETYLFPIKRLLKITHILGNSHLSLVGI
jgi:hypothetical protein